MGGTRAHGRVLVALACAALPFGVAGAAGAHLGHSAQAVPSADYGGGMLGSGYSKRAFRANVVTLRVSGDGASASVHGFARIPCEIPSYNLHGTYATERGKTSLDAAGRFTFRKSVRYTASPKVRARQTVTITGRAVGGQASGTLRVRKTFRRRGRRSAYCDSGDQRWEARTAAGLTDVPAPPKPGAAYYGPAPQAAPLGAGAVSLRVSSDGSRIEFATELLDMGCRVRGLDHNALPPTAIRPDGTFSLTHDVSQSYSGVRERYVITLSGKFVAGGVRGTLGEKLTVREGGRTSRCSKANVPFAATP